MRLRGYVLKPTVSIHGSCVSRDLAEFHDYSVTNYQARSSICTKGTVASEYDSKYLASISSKFQRRMVEWDLSKRNFRTHESDFIILDLIDERFDIYFDGVSCVTRSQAFHQSGVLRSLNEDFQRVERGTELYFELFRNGLEKFRSCLDKPLVFHDARWATHYQEGTKRVKFETQQQIYFENNLLEDLSKIVREEIFPALIVEKPELCIGDAGHKWGPASFHFIPEYYREIDNQIMSNIDKIISG